MRNLAIGHCGRHEHCEFFLPTGSLTAINGGRKIDGRAIAAMREERRLDAEQIAKEMEARTWFHRYEIVPGI